MNNVISETLLCVLRAGQGNAHVLSSHEDFSYWGLLSSVALTFDAINKHYPVVDADIG